MAEKKWEDELAKRYQGYHDLHPVDRRRCTESFIRNDRHGANARIIRIMTNGGIGPHGAADRTDDYLTAAPVLGSATADLPDDTTNDGI